MHTVGTQRFAKQVQLTRQPTGTHTWGPGLSVHVSLLPFLRALPQDPETTCCGPELGHSLPSVTLASLQQLQHRDLESRVHSAPGVTPGAGEDGGRFRCGRLQGPGLERRGRSRTATAASCRALSELSFDSTRGPRVAPLGLPVRLLGSAAELVRPGNRHRGSVRVSPGGSDCFVSRRVVLFCFVFLSTFNCTSWSLLRDLTRLFGTKG